MVNMEFKISCVIFMSFYLQFFSKDRLDRPLGVRNFLTVFRDFFLKARTLSWFKFYRLKVNFSSKREPYRANTMNFFLDFNIKNNILIEFIILKTDIYEKCFALTVFSSTVPALYKNARIFTPVRFALMIFFLNWFVIN